jgi:hypothetical protein
MRLTLALTGLAVVAYAWERLPLELSSIGILGRLLLLFDQCRWPATARQRFRPSSC